MTFWWFEKLHAINELCNRDGSDNTRQYKMMYIQLKICKFMIPFTLPFSNLGVFECENFDKIWSGWLLAKAQKWFRDRGSSGGFQRQPLHRAPYPRAPYCPAQPKIRLWNQRKGRKKQVIKSLQIQIYCVTVRQPKCQTKDKSKSSSGKTSFTIYPAWNYDWPITWINWRSSPNSSVVVNYLLIRAPTKS